MDTDTTPNRREIMKTPICKDICQIRVGEYFITYGRLLYCFSGRVAEKITEVASNDMDFVVKAQVYRLDQAPDNYYILVFESVTQPGNLLLFKSLQFEQKDKNYTIIAKTVPVKNLFIA